MNKQKSKIEQSKVEYKNLSITRARVSGELMRLFYNGYFTLKEMADVFGATQRTVQRDLKSATWSVNNFLTLDPEKFKIKYDSTIDGYRFQQGDLFNFEEALAVIKVIIGSRAFSKDDVNSISKHLIQNLSDDHQDIARRMIADTMNKYYPVKTVSDLIPRVKIFLQWINQKTTIDFTYQSSVSGSDASQKRLGVPLSLYFSENYFYVTLYDDKHKSSRIYRLDRFITFRRSTHGKLKVPQAAKPDVGELRKKTYLLSGGGDIRLEFWYRGYPQTALDRFPESKVIETRYSEDGSHEVLIQCRNVARQGAKLWLMSQGALVSGVKPSYLRKEIREELQQMMMQY